MIQQNLQKLFEKNMNRKEFLAHIGAGALMVIGVSGLLKSLVHYNGGSKTRSVAGYGSSAYGGGDKK